MRKWIKAKVLAWAWRQLLDQQQADEDKLINFTEGNIPKSTDPVQRHLDYWINFRAALNSPQGALIIYRVQLIYNKLHNSMRLLDLNKEANAKVLPMIVAQMQKLYEVLSLQQIATSKILLLQNKLELERGGQFEPEEEARQTRAGLPRQSWQTQG